MSTPQRSLDAAYRLAAALHTGAVDFIEVRNAVLEVITAAVEQHAARAPAPAPYGAPVGAYAAACQHVAMQDLQDKADALDQPRADDAEALLRRWIAWYVGGDAEDLGELVERTRERHASSVERRDGDSWSITHAGIRWPAYASTEMDANTIRDALNRDTRALAIVRRLVAWVERAKPDGPDSFDSISNDARALAEEEALGGR